MPDMLVNLRNLPEFPDTGPIDVRRANSWDRKVLRRWVKKQFGEDWAECVDAAFTKQPIPCFVIVERARPGRPRDLILGFACYDVAARGVFGPMGVVTSERKQGLGGALLVGTLHAMQFEGYAYAIIGQVGPADFYRKVVGATLIPGPGDARIHLE